MIKNLNVKSKILFALLAVTFITAAMVGIIAVGLGVATLKEEFYKKLTAIRELKANQIENLKQYVESFGLVDLFLVSTETGKVLYSVKNEVETGTSLTEGLYTDTNLARAFRKAAASVDPEFSIQTDFEHFRPSNGILTSFTATSIYINGEKTGVLIYQMPIDRINNIMTDNQDWRNMGLGDTEETYLAGEDNLMRNQSRFLIEDSADYFKMIHFAGMPSETISRIRVMKSGIGIQPVKPEETYSALGGETGTGMFTDYRGQLVLAAYKPLKIGNLNWVIISKIDRNEVMKGIRLLFIKFLFYFTLLFLLVVSFSIVFARDFSRPVEALAKVNEQLKIQSAAMVSAANGIIITDIKGIVHWVNPAFTRLTGYHFDEIVGNSLKVLGSGVQSIDFFKNMWSKILAGEVWHDEVVNKKKDGSFYTEEMTITPVRDSNGKISQFVAIKQDITERKKLEQIMKSANERMEDELNVARDIQMSMLPLKFPAFPEREDMDVYAKLIPAREVGGDFYDFYFIDEENLCFVVGDVSGKGVPAALFMAVTKALIKAAAHNVTSPARILTLINNEISQANENSMFITVFLAILNTTTGHLVYTNAGHNPSFVFRSGDGNIQKLTDMHGVAIGAWKGVSYKETVLQLNRGDTIFTYTDGVTEAQDKQGKFYSERRLMNLLQNYTFIGCKEMVHYVVDDVIRYENGAEHADDITILAVHFSEQTADYKKLNLKGK